MRLTVIAHPNSKSPRVEKDLLGEIHVYVNEPPLEGRANNAVAHALAKYFEVKRSEVIIISGEKSKNKLFEILKNKPI